MGDLKVSFEDELFSILHQSKCGTPSAFKLRSRRGTKKLSYHTTGTLVVKGEGKGKGRGGGWRRKGRVPGGRRRGGGGEWRQKNVKEDGRIGGGWG